MNTFELTRGDLIRALRPVVHTTVRRKAEASARRTGEAGDDAGPVSRPAAAVVPDPESNR